MLHATIAGAAAIAALGFFAMALGENLFTAGATGGAAMLIGKAIESYYPMITATLEGASKMSRMRIGVAYAAGTAVTASALATTAALILTEVID